MAHLELQIDVKNLDEVKAEIDRLTTLILKAEDRGCHCGGCTMPSGCPWCESSTTYEDIGRVVTHAATCPAFSGTGQVR